MKKIVIANWKMNFGVKQSVEFVNKFISRKQENKKTRKQIVICPSFVALSAVGKLLKNTPIALGAQNVGEADKGAWTGEVSVEMLKELGCEYVIIGHSERRQKLGETNQQINAKIKLVLRAGLTPILCVGETREERDGGLVENVITKQVEEGLADVDQILNPKSEILNKSKIQNPKSKTNLKSENSKFIQNSKFKIQNSFIVAYEPIWAIGQNPPITPTIGEIEQVHRLIAETLKNNNIISYNIIYGGSVNGANVAKLFASDLIQGGLVGGASLNLEEFLKIVKID